MSAGKVGSANQEVGTGAISSLFTGDGESSLLTCS